MTITHPVAGEKIRESFLHDLTTAVNNMLSLDVQTFTGAANWARPVNGRVTWVRQVASGGGGGGVDGQAVANAGGGAGAGGGGEYGELWVATQLLPATVAVACGALGAGGVAGLNNGAAGATTSFGAYLTCLGGSGGTGKQGAASNSNTAGGAGGTGGAGAGAGTTYHEPGLAGRSCRYSLTAAVVTRTSVGGDSAMGRGGVSQAALGDTSAGGAGVNASGYGGGGSGAVCRVNNATDYAGGDGTGGYVLAVSW